MTCTEPILTKVKFTLVDPLYEIYSKLFKCIRKWNVQRTNQINLYSTELLSSVSKSKLLWAVLILFKATEMLKMSLTLCSVEETTYSNTLSIAFLFIFTTSSSYAWIVSVRIWVILYELTLNSLWKYKDRVEKIIRLFIT